MSRTGKRSFVSVIVGILILSTVLKNLKVARALAVGVVAALVLAGMAGTGAAVSGLVAEWHFDGSAQDTSGSGNHGTINGATFVQGISGQALTFDGNDYVDMGTGTGVDGSGLYTATLWNNDMVNSFESVSTPFALDAGSFSRNLLSNSFGSGNNGGLSYYRMVSFDISGLPGLTGYNYIDVHWTMSCGNDNINGRFKVPEPAGVVLMGLGLLGLAATSLRRRRMSELALRLPSNHPFTIGSRQN